MSPAVMRRATFVGVLLITSYLESANPLQCQAFHDPLLAEICGYNHTLTFQDQNLYRVQALHVIDLTYRPCSKYSSVMVCSQLLPRCIEGLEGPYLPCKRVCEAYARECRANGNTLEDELYILKFCHLLPEYDDPETTKGYLGRCFEPAGFEPTSAADLQCFKLSVPVCQGLGYNETTWPAPIQQHKAASLPYYIHRQSPCGHLERQFYCVRFIKPCQGHKLLVFCRHHCERIVRTCHLEGNETDKRSVDPNFCQRFPRGDSSSALCSITDWPFADQWPKSRWPGNGVPSASSAITQAEPQHHVQVTTPIIASVLVVSAIVLVLVVLLLHRKRQARRSFGYEHSAESAVLEIPATD